MSEKSLFATCEPNDPRRCQAVTGHGQCQYRAVENSNFCMLHGGNKGQEKAAKENYRNYQIERYKARIDSKLASSKIINLREEIAILRMLLETKLNRVNDDVDLLINSQGIADLVMKVGDVVQKCHKLETSLDQLIDKDTLHAFGQKVIGILCDNLKGHEDIIKKVSEELVYEIESLGRNSSDDD